MHELVGVNTLAKIKRKLESVTVDLIAEVNNVLELALLDKSRYLVKYLLDGRGLRYLQYINAIFGGIVYVL